MINHQKLPDMYTLKVSANTPSYLRKVISNVEYHTLSTRDQQFYVHVRDTVEHKPETKTIVAKDLLGNDALRTVDRNISDER